MYADARCAIGKVAYARLRIRIKSALRATGGKMGKKVICENCRHKHFDSDTVWVGIISAGAHGFNVHGTMHVCPECYGVENTLQRACDENGCWKTVTCGTPTPNGYRNTCSKHAP